MLLLRNAANSAVDCDTMVLSINKASISSGSSNIGGRRTSLQKSFLPSFHTRKMTNSVKFNSDIGSLSIAKILVNPPT